MSEPILAVEHLRTHLFTRQGVVKAVEDVSLTVHPGQIRGLVGESGSGKSMIAYSIMGLVEPVGRVVGGRILFQGQELRGLPEARMRALRGNRVAMIFQDPAMTLNPVLRVGTQVEEALLAHRRVSRSAARAEAREALARVGIPSPDERLAAYPHQLSGGMRQRVVIAIALINEPALLIADEPTTALDVTIQGQILHQVQRLCRESGTALLWITHDLTVVAGLADTVSVLYAGRIVEQGSVRQVIERPMHPYTRGLILSSPGCNVPGQPLRQIPGMMPAPWDVPRGCAFRDRCARADARCAEEPPLEPLAGGGQVRCFHPHRDEPVLEPKASGAVA